MRIYSEMRDGVVVGGMSIDVDGRDGLWSYCLKMNGSCVSGSPVGCRTQFRRPGPSPRVPVTSTRRPEQGAQTLPELRE